MLSQNVSCKGKKTKNRTKFTINKKPQKSKKSKSKKKPLKQ